MGNARMARRELHGRAVTIAVVALFVCLNGAPCEWRDAPARSAAECRAFRSRTEREIAGRGVIFDSRCEDATGAEVVEWNWRDLPPTKSRGR